MCENICALKNLDDTTVLRNLEERFQNRIIYTYVSNVLIAVNPFEDLPLYGPQQKTLYANSGNLHEKPPHVYAIGYEAYKNLKCHKKKQSIIITGVSGSGKTESGKHILDFLCQAKSGSQNVIAAAPICEAFGNARTRANRNSSRYCKLVELVHDASFKYSGAKICSKLLESNRVFATKQNESNFHVFYALILGAPNEILKDIGLDQQISYNYIPDKDLFVENTDWRHKFNTINNSLTALGFTDDQKTSMNKSLSAILNIGNIEFEETGIDEGCSVKRESRGFLFTAAALLNIKEAELEEALTSYIRVTRNETIKSFLNNCAAEKTRNNLVKGLYDKLFGEIMQHVNHHLSYSSSDSSISILDIAGFEYLTDESNTFDQLCINYTNERMQSLFVTRKISDEKQWYDSQGIDIPFVEFFDNSHIIDVFHHKTKGLLNVLNDECKKPTPSVVNFTSNLRNAWQSDLKAPISWKKSQNSVFVIKHFTNDVSYSTDDFVEKSQNNMTNVVSLMIQKSNGLSTKSNLDDDESGPKFTCKSSATTLRIEIDSLIEQLNKTEAHFIRCISPNSTKQGGKFDDGLVLKQLITSGTTAFARFMRVGYSDHLPLEKMTNVFELVENKFGKWSAHPSNFYTKVLLSLGFKLKDFKIGKDSIFFRANKILSLEKVFRDIKAISNSRLLITKQTRHPKSFSDNPLERIEGFFLQSKLRSAMLAVRFLTKCKICIRNSKMNVTDTQSSGLLELARPPLPPLTPPENPENPQLPQKESMNQDITMKNVPSAKPTSRKRVRLPLEREITAKKQFKSEKRPHPKQRFNDAKHLPVIDKSKLVRCKKEGCEGKSYIYCSDCKVHLCINIPNNRNCFTEFHKHE